MTVAPADKRSVIDNGQMTTTTTKNNNNEDSPDSSGWSASLYNKTASFVYSADFVAPVLSLLNVKPGERILDLGCGSGEVTLAIEKGFGGGTRASSSDFCEDGWGGDGEP